MLVTLRGHRVKFYQKEQQLCTVYLIINNFQQCTNHNIIDTVRHEKIIAILYQYLN